MKHDPTDKFCICEVCLAETEKKRAESAARQQQIATMAVILMAHRKELTPRTAAQNAAEIIRASKDY